MLIGGIEAGGTKIVYGIAERNGKDIRLIDRKEIPTKSGEETLKALLSYFEKTNIEVLGLASFGPLELNPLSADYGMVNGTPKKGWNQFPFRRKLQENLKIPIVVDTDVNSAMLAEVMYGAAKGCHSAVYITVGTGIGVGIWMNGALVHGLLHPEVGHIAVLRKTGDTYEGICPFHRDEKGRSCCLEGLAAGPAIEGRWGKSGKELNDDNIVWDMESHYLAQGIQSLILTCSPEKIIMGGGVMHQKRLFPLIREKVRKNLGGYIKRKEILTGIDQYIIPPALGDDAGLTGALALTFLDESLKK